MSLNAYQKATVKHLVSVYKEQQVYLVADEVGLGKTYVAQGLIKDMGFKRIIYIASNPEVAEQNAKELCGKEAVLTNIDRLSMLEAASQYSGDDTGGKKQIWTKEPTRPWVLPLSPATTFTGTGSALGNEKERKHYAKHSALIAEKWHAMWKNEATAQKERKHTGKDAQSKEKEDQLVLQYLKDDQLLWLDRVKKNDKQKIAEKNALERAFRLLRHCFCEVAVSSFQPDLIILDEFHRFHQLLNPQQFAYQHYSLKEMLQTANAGKGAQQNKVKILLLSATPYVFQTSAFKHAYQGENSEDRGNDAEQHDAYGKPFSKFEDLITYIKGLETYSGGSQCGWEARDAAQFAPEDYYKHVLCRTERKWLQANQKDVPYQERMWSVESAYQRMAAHMVYRKEYLRTLLIDAAKKSGLTDDLAKKRISDSSTLARTSEKKDAIQSYSNVRTYLDEAPEYAQFGDAYKTVAQGDGVSTTFPKMRAAFSEVLRQSGRYRIRKAETGNEPKWEEFEKTYGHAKWDLLKEMAMPEGAEMRLWVPPAKTNDEFSKTVVFAHYRLSTRSIAALTSMEAQKRLSQRMQAANLLTDTDALPEIRLNPEQLQQLMSPVQEFLAFHKESRLTDEVACKSLVNLAESIQIFFNTTYAKRVLAAWSKTEATGDTVLAYCKGYDWHGMVWEYLECLCGMGLNPTSKKLEEAVQELAEVLAWTDEMRTRVLILPDWSDEGYPCTYGERYTQDYLDKKGHDAESSQDDKKKIVATKRLKKIRQRFQSPFYPFVLAASETAQEGVNLHNYCSNIFHWSVPSSLNTFTQEGGRVDRRASLTVRRQALWLQRFAAPESILDKSISQVFGEIEDIYLALGYQPEILEKLKGQGLFPYWFLPAKDEWLGKGFPQLQRVLFGMPMSKDDEDYRWLLKEQKQYRTFGIRTNGKELSDSELKNAICPFFKEYKAT